ncbi:MAG: WbqC family protein [Bdellovibrionales bacterium]|nr:WbqC family protein [Bdellovibrionales bacterium]
MKLAILQPNYIPWRGYFDLIGLVDVFVLYDDVQYTKDDWRNRNQILGPSGPFWLTIPVKTKGLMGQKINEVKVLQNNWQKKHWRSIEVNYQKAPFFKNYGSELFELYQNEFEFLIDVNKKFIFKICEWLGIRTKIICSSEIVYAGESASEKVLSICEVMGATEYLSGPSAKNYLNEKLFEQNSVKVNYMDYSKYKPYPQLFSGFESHPLSIIDLLFNCGSESIKYLLIPKSKSLSTAR